jgi:hypothetical protein
LLHIVDVEGRYAIAALGSVVEQLPESYACHAELLVTAAVHKRSRPTAYRLHVISQTGNCGII